MDRPADHLFELLVAADHVNATLVVQATRLGELEWPARAVDQLHAQAFLQVVHQLAGAGLRHAIQLGRFREAAEPDDVAEHLEGLELQLNLPIRSRSSIGYSKERISAAPGERQPAPDPAIWGDQTKAPGPTDPGAMPFGEC